MKNSITLVLVWISSFCYGQSFEGLWQVDEVKVGEEILTPVAKWFKYDEDGTYTGGNGWLQNEAGTWNFDSQGKLFSATNTYGLDDPYEAFRVSEERGKMTWTREEEGMKVVVSLSKVEKMPKSSADWLVGMWRLTAAEKGGQDNLGEIDPNDKVHYFIRWDRIFLYWDAEGKRRTGYWHINGHKPEITLLSHWEEDPAETWRVEPGVEILRMTGISETNQDQVLTFERKRSFPD